MRVPRVRGAISAPETLGITFRSLIMDHTEPVDIAAFVADLRRQEVAPTTVTSYATDLRAAARWFTDTTGEAFAAAVVTPTDLREYRAHLRTVERRAPATVNRRLAALRRFFTWAKATGRVRELPT